MMHVLSMHLEVLVFLPVCVSLKVLSAPVSVEIGL